MRLKHYIVYSFCAMIFCQCSREAAPLSGNGFLSGMKRDSSLKYAKRFSIAENRYCKIVYLFGNLKIGDTSACFVILKDSSIRIPAAKNRHIIKGSCKRIASLSSVYSSMLCELGEAGRIVAIENIDYYNNPAILEKYAKGELKELAKNPEMDIEQTIILKPDIVFTFGMGNPDKGPNEKVVRAGIPMVITVDHLEETPLARAEWIKFFAAFVNRDKEARELFAEVERNYTALKTLALSAATQPSVFTEIKYGEIWYLPGGKSYAATFIRDANAAYVWNNDTKTGSLHLGFEEVYLKAKEADFWLNQSMVRSRAELLALESRYAEFKAFKTGQLYNNIKNTNQKGFSDYWETGIIFPDRVLSDLILIFHPELAPRVKNDLYYYKKLE
jgi:iron complex transport system substrate-binding protein